MTIISVLIFVCACILGLFIVVKSSNILMLSIQESYWVPIPLWVRAINFLIGVVGVLCGLSIILFGMYGVIT
jgi:hypothetical protein